MFEAVRVVAAGVLFVLLGAVFSVRAGCLPAPETTRPPAPLRGERCGAGARGGSAGAAAAGAAAAAGLDPACAPELARGAGLDLRTSASAGGPCWDPCRVPCRACACPDSGSCCKLDARLAPPMSVVGLAVLVLLCEGDGVLESLDCGAE